MRFSFMMPVRVLMFHAQPLMERDAILLSMLYNAVFPAFDSNHGYARCPMGVRLC